MVRMNARFVDLLASTRKPIMGELHPALIPLVRKGIVKVGRLHFLQEFIQRQSTAPKNLDAIGLEDWVNRFHLEDYARTDLLRQSLRFMNEMFKRWRRQRSVGTLNSFVSLPTESKAAVVSFHLARHGLAWLSDDFEGYQNEAVLEISSRDAAFFKLL